MRNVVLASFLILALAATALLWFDGEDGQASSHREAPMMMLDPTADITDVYAFVSPDDPTTVTLLANVIPFEEPNGGPNFFRFDPNVLYTLRIDNDGDAVEDIVYEFNFQDDIQNGGTFLYNTGPLESVEDADYNFQQTYSVTRVDSSNGQRMAVGSNLTVPPANIGPASTPDYDALATGGVYEVGGAKVFAGQRDDPFFVDLGAIFDLLTIRPGAPGNSGGGVDGVGGFNVHTIAIQVPIEDLTADGAPLSEGDEDAVIGVWATTSRRSMTVINSDGTRDHTGDWVQVSRLGLPLINEAVVPLAFKNFFLSSQPRNDAANYVAPFNGGGPILDPELPQLLNLLYGLEVPPAPRTDIVEVLLLGVEGLNRPMNAGDGGVVPSDMIRLNMGLAPVAAGDEGFSILGVIGGDLGGYPNGRRLEDDVTDISLRVLAGVLVEGFNVSPNNALGDGVEANDKPFLASFPYVATPWQGFEHDHHPVGDDVQTAIFRTGDVPERFGLFQNYPNPFNPQTQIEYELREAGQVRIDVFDVQGRLIQTLVNTEQTAGRYALSWNGTDTAGRRVASGTYLYRLSMGGQVQARTMVLVK